MFYKELHRAIKKPLLAILFAAVFLMHTTPAAASAPDVSSELESSNAVVTKTKRATLFYAKARGLAIDQAQLQAGDFFRLFYTFLEKADSQSEVNNPKSVAALEELLTRYDLLIASSGNDLKARESQLEALSLAVVNPSNENDELLSLKFLKQFHALINHHELSRAKTRQPANGNDPIRINLREVAKAVGTYSIWGFCLRTTFFFLTHEYNLHPYLSEPVLIQMAAISLAAAPYSAMNQVYLQAEKRIGQSIIEWRKRRSELHDAKAIETPKGNLCQDLFSGA